MCVTLSAGKGSFGTVYRGLYVTRPVAVKCFENLTALTAKEARVIKREARIMHIARNAHIIEFVGFSLESSLIVTELALCSLHDVLHKEFCLPGGVSFTNTLKMSWFQQVADGLNFLHFHGIIHRDVKPQNVLLVHNSTSGNDELVAKMSDFGISTAVGMSSMGTNKDIAVGTVPYMAPELIDIEGAAPVYTTAVDIYAFGVLMNETMSGVLPWEGLRQITISKELDKGKRPILFTATSVDEEQLRSVVIGNAEKGCLASAATNRHSAADILDMLQSLVNSPFVDISEMGTVAEMRREEAAVAAAALKAKTDEEARIAAVRAKEAAELEAAAKQKREEAAAVAAAAVKAKADEEARQQAARAEAERILQVERAARLEFHDWVDDWIGTSLYRCRKCKSTYHYKKPNKDCYGISG